MSILGEKPALEMLLDSTGNPVKLDKSDYTVMYFYPRDNTPGCTIEANEFQVLKPKFDKANIRILGVSADSAASHKSFCEKFGLAFELVTDPDGILGKKLGIFEKRHLRTTYVLDKKGVVVLSYPPKVKAQGHAEAVLEDIGRLVVRSNSG